jgi:hypothetical protein
MELPYRRTRRADSSAAGQDDRLGLPELGDRSCCCPAIPVVRVLIPPTSVRPQVDLLLCGRHYRASRAALAARGAMAIDEAGTVLNLTSVSNETQDAVVVTPRT